MKRHPAFQDLSRDHYVALNRSLQLVRAVEGHPTAWPYSQALAAFEMLWARDGLPQHFDEEETDLVPVLRETEGGRVLAERMLAEHEQFRAAFEGLRQARPEEVARTARLLTAHARWEEETVFESLQRTLPEARLQELLARSLRFRGANGRPVTQPKTP